MPARVKSWTRSRAMKNERLFRGSGSGRLVEVSDSPSAPTTHVTGLGTVLQAALLSAAEASSRAAREERRSARELTW
jgi:hypothetical protein